MCRQRRFFHHMSSFCVMVGSSGGSDNPELRDRITAFLRQTYGAVFSRLGFTWIVSAEETADHIRDNLLSDFDEIRYLLVVRAGPDAAWAGFNELDSDWLQRAL
jgi:hypothetical protein